MLRQALNYHFGRFGSVVSVKIKREKDVRPVDPRKKEGDVWAWLSFAVRSVRIPSHAYPNQTSMAPP